jgi:pSer/pThr/pTyr-binding forkhead associated (FHA) protein
LFCNQCGHHNPADARFCSSCGAPLTVAPDTTVTIPRVDPLQEVPGEEQLLVSLADVAEGTGVLIVRSGSQAGQRFALEGEITRLGRSTENEISLDDITVSRHHADIVASDGGFKVRDAGSLNGTYLNLERIDGDATLGNGDEIQVGKFRLVFFVAPG